MAGRSRGWSREELLIVLRLYLQTDFGRLHQGNPDIKAIASRIGRTPGAVAMKATNFASLDPKITGTGRKGLRGASAADREVWAFMEGSIDAFEEQSADAGRRLTGTSTELPGSGDSESEFVLPSQEQTETVGSVRQRRKQAFFRRTVLAAYQGACAISGIAVPDLLSASHIIPWSIDHSRRIDPTNGIALNALYDRAFDRGLISLDRKLRVIASSRLRHEPMSEMHRLLLADVAGLPASRPLRFQPDPAAIEYHRDVIFVP